MEDGKLTGIAETKNIIKTADGAEANEIPLNVDSLVSMNVWCYPADFVSVLKERFPVFLEKMTDPLKDEFLLPTIADHMLKVGIEYSVLPTDDHWFGVTSKEDKPLVVESFRKLLEDGVYRDDLYTDL